MRIVALSDQHGYLPAIPDYDLLIVAGDICPDRFGPFLAIHHPLAQKAWFDNHARPWLARARAQYKIVTWGNHDWCGQACSFREYFDDGQAADKTFIVVDDAVRVPTLDAPAGSLLIWATPWSNRFLNWAFMKDPNELEPVYAAIPDDVDILVSHQPPYGYGDQVPTAGGRVDHLGSRELLAAIRRVKPGLVICGHVHEAHGRSEFNGTIIHNVAVVDEQYRVVHEPTVIDFSI